MSHRIILLLDNRDSFVWNLAQAFGSLGREVRVVRSDQVSAAKVQAMRPAAVVLSPGPGRPEGAGVCIEVIHALTGMVPILGVCLGHQAIAAAFGARIERAAPCHGKPWPVEHTGVGLFRGLPSPLHACRYHSLVVDRSSLPADFVVDATTPEGIVMAMRHRDQPTFGVQFHPESFCTEHGLALLGNFLGVAT